MNEIKQPIPMVKTRPYDYMGSIWTHSGEMFMLVMVSRVYGFSLVSLESGEFLHEPSEDFVEVVEGAVLVAMEARLTIEPLNYVEER